MRDNKAIAGGVPEAELADVLDAGAALDAHRLGAVHAAVQHRVLALGQRWKEEEYQGCQRV